MTEEKKMKRLSVRMGDELYSMLEDMSKEMGMTKQGFILHAVLKEIYNLDYLIANYDKDND